MITREEAWEIAMDAAEQRKPVSATCRDGKRFSGILTHVDFDYLIVGGLGFPLTDLTDLEVQP